MYWCLLNVLHIGRGGREGGEGGVDFFLKSNDPNREGGEQISSHCYAKDRGQKIANKLAQGGEGTRMKTRMVRMNTLEKLKKTPGKELGGGGGKGGLPFVFRVMHHSSCS